MKINFIGTGGFGSLTKRSSSGYFIKDECLYIIDMGADNVKFYKEYLMNNKAKEIIICVTHTHQDHAAGIPEFLIWVSFFYDKQKRIEIIATKEVLACLKHLLAVTGCNNFLHNVMFNEDYGVVTTIETKHVKAIPSCAFIFRDEDRKVTLYSGDTNEPLLKKFEDFCLTYKLIPHKIYHEVSEQKTPAHTSLEELEVDFNKTTLLKKQDVVLFHCEESKTLKESGFELAVQKNVVAE